MRRASIHCCARRHCRGLRGCIRHYSIAPQEELAGLDDVVVSWSENAKDIPDEWRTVVDGFLNSDINGGLDCWSSWLSGNDVVIEHVPPFFAHQSHSGGFDLSF